jgi:3-deoxy-D-manno-octulosonate 8-phosphate phosphatase (KDO 8-P phosphatase)
MKTSKKPIKMVIFDIDGVFTDGTIIISEDGKESKKINFKDIDAFFQIKHEGFKTAFVTGESTPIALWFKKRFEPDYFISGCKDKASAVKDILQKGHFSSKDVCYIGDSKHDIPAFDSVGLKVCPNNATPDVKSVCDVSLTANGGDGAVAEIAKILIGMSNINKYS